MRLHHFLNLTIAFTIVFLFGCAGPSLSDEAIPSDGNLIAVFQGHRAVFDQLLGMIKKDSGLCRVDCDWTAPTNPQDVGVNPERIKDYRQLLDEIHCHRGFEAFPARPGIHFISVTRGVVAGGLAKGFYYFEGTPDCLVTNTDTYRPKPNEYSYEIFRPIEGHWYIYLEVD